MASELNIVIKANNQASAVFRELQGDLDKLDKKTGTLGKGFSALQTGMGAALKVVGVGAVAAGAAVTGVAVKGVQEFAKFESSMNEVFTLLPGISDRAMGDMTQQVKDFAVEFGTLPNEVVPALYQSLSAGVPADNVFAFLETAQKAAIGGVADLETAVDGISSTVNAYGADILSATEASDQMFTAVRLGKTTFGELSNSLFNVIPVASALGVEFGDVAAGIAAITSQGVPTSVATTQMRQAFVELSKDGGETAELFERLAGESFRDFIASGKNTQQALQLLERYAQDTGVGINDLFGSVEAGNAVLALTGKGTEAFTNALNEMETSAGATQAAFDQMMQGLQPIFDRLKAMWQVALLDIGNAIGPALEPVVSWLERILPAAIDIAVSFFEKIGTAAGTFFTALEDGETPLSAFRLALASLLTPEQVQWLSDLEENIRGVISAIDTATQPIQDFITKWVELKDVMIALGIVAGVTLVSALSGIAGALAAPLLALGALTLAVAAVRTAWEADFLGIQTIVTSLITYFDNLIKSGDTLNDMLTKVPAPIANIADALGDAYTAWKRYGSAAQVAIAFFDNFADHFEVVRIVNKVRDALNRARRAVDTFLTSLSDGKTPIAAFREALGSILSFEQAMFLSMMEMGIRGVITAITEAVTPIANFVAEWVKWQDVLIAIGIYAIPSLVGALGTLLAPIGALALALAGPLVTIALLTAAVAALRIAWETNFLNIKTVAQDVFGELDDLWNGLMTAFSTGDTTALTTALSEIATIIGNWIRETTITIVEKVGEWASAFSMWVKQVWPGLKIQLSMMWTSFSGWIAETAVTIAHSVGEWASAFSGWAGEVWTTLKPEVDGMFTLLKNWIGLQKLTLQTRLLEWKTQFSEWAGDVWAVLKPKVDEMFTLLKNWIGLQKLTLQTRLLEWKTGFSEWAGGIWATLKPNLDTLIADIKGWIGEQVPTLAEAVGAWKTVLSGLETQATEAAATVKSVIAGITGQDSKFKVPELVWDDYINTLTWDDYIVKIDWKLQMGSFEWGDYVKEFDWGKAVQTALDWNDYITELPWVDYIKKIISWTTWIPALTWNSFVVMLDWLTYLGVIAWTDFISKLTWKDVVGEVTWEERIDRLDWNTLVEPLKWAPEILIFSWETFVEKLKWPIIAEIVWDNWISKLRWPSVDFDGWSTWVDELSWPDVSFDGWDTWIDNLSWPDVSFDGWSTWIDDLQWPVIVWPGWRSFIPAFPGWPNIRSMIQSAINGRVSSAGGFEGPGAATGTGSGGRGGEKASGTMFFEGGLATINERGPELILMPGRNRQAVLPRGTQILTAEQTAALAGAGGVNQYNTFNIYSDLDLESITRRISFNLQRNNRR